VEPLGLLPVGSEVGDGAGDLGKLGRRIVGRGSALAQVAHEDGPLMW
jgi:hypothetical protein